MKALLDGGPAEGVIQVEESSTYGRIWTIEIVHSDCICEWCAKVDGRVTEHIYERRDDDVFAYRRSQVSAISRLLGPR